MFRRTVSGVLLILLLASMLMLAFNVQPFKANPTEIISDTRVPVAQSTTSETITVQGKATLEEASDQSGISVQVWTPEPSHNKVAETTTESDGFYQITGVPSLSGNNFYWVEAFKDGYADDYRAIYSRPLVVVDDMVLYTQKWVSFDWVYQPDGTTNLSTGNLSSGSVVLYSFVYGTGGSEACGFIFSTHSVTNPAADVYFSDQRSAPYSFWANNGAGGVLDMGAVSLDNVTEAPDVSNGVGVGGLYHNESTDVFVRHTYCIVTKDGSHYAKIYVTGARARYVNVSVAKQMIESDPNLTILDVRTQSEYDAEHIQNATLIPVADLSGRLGELDKNKEILVYCASGGRSATASQILVDNGFSKVYNMLGGIAAWKSAGYWIEIVHNGDLIINGTQTFVIENCTYIQTGGILVSDSGKLVVRNSKLRINQTYLWHYVFRIEDFGGLKTENSVLTSDQALNFDFNEYSTADFSNVTLNLGEGSFFRFHELSKATVNQFNISNWHVLLFDGYSEALIINSVIYEIIVMDPACSIAASNSSIDWFSLQFGSNNSMTIDHLEPGFYEHLNLQETVINGLPCDIVLSNTYVDKWAVHSNYDSETTILDSTIARFLLFIDGYPAQMSDLSPGFYEYKQVGTILLNRTDITDWVVVHVFNSTVTITNSTMILSPHSNSDVHVVDSLVTLEILGDYSSGSLCFDRTTIIDRMFIFYADFFMYGNVSFANLEDIRFFSTNMTRNYNIILRYVNQNPVENTELTLFNQNHTFIWDGVTDGLGQANFNLTFTDSNYTDMLRLEATKNGFVTASQNLTFLSNTPVIFVMHELLLGDINQDFTVDILDAIILAGSFNSRSGDPRWNTNADLNSDGIVDLYDAIILANNYGKTA